MIPDPALFLSTIVLASGALVAIVGGLLVARFVGLDTDQQSNRRVLIAADGRLIAARRRSTEAQESLLDWDSQDFFAKPAVLAAIGGGVSEPAELRRLEPCFLSEQVLPSLVSSVMEDFARARDVLSKQASLTDFRRWNDFRKSTELPQIRWPMVWREVFDEIVKKRKAEENADRQKARRAGHIVGMDPTALLKLSDAPDLRGVTTGWDRQRRHELAATYERARQRVEDYEDELQRLRDEHAEIIRPDKRLWVGVAILAAFAVVSVAWPMYVMSTGPTDLAAVQWFIWPFCAVLTALIVYVVAYLLNLSRRKLPTIGGTAEDNRAAVDT